jgi:LAS superfamily LD-carboxypeptidase LdcB
MTPSELTGRTDTHITPAGEPAIPLHRNVAEPFARMQQAAARDGIALTPISGFRSFEKQAAIWNAKWRGERQLHDVHGRPVNHSTLSGAELAHTILIWSALPGASRHHWGTDVDVIDAAARPPGYEVQLLPSEYLEGGYFHRLHLWLQENMATFDFFLPYKTFQGGISTEPWHISYAPISMPALQDLSLDVLRQTVENNHIEGKEVVLKILPEIYDRYVLNINLPETEEQDVL